MGWGTHCWPALVLGAGRSRIPGRGVCREARYGRATGEAARRRAAEVFCRGPCRYGWLPHRTRAFSSVQDDESLELLCEQGPQVARSREPLAQAAMAPA